MGFRNGKAKIQAAGADKVRAWVVADEGGGETLQPMGWGVRGCSDVLRVLGTGGPRPRRFVCHVF